MRKPFYRSSHKCWYVKRDNGSFIRLDPEESTAYQIWQRMVASGCDSGLDATFYGLAESFVAEHEALLGKSAFDAVCRHAGTFASHVGTDRIATEISKSEVVKWLRESKPGRKRKDGSVGKSKVWSLYAQRDAGAILKRIFKWAHDEGRIAKNPLAGLKLAQPRPRTQTVSYSMHARLIQDCQQSDKSRSFMLYLIASRCGARPQQIREVTANHVLADGTAWVFGDHKTRNKTKRPLVVYLSPCLQTLTRILAVRHPSGSMFRTDSGQSWKKDTVCRRMSRLRTRLGLPDVIAYSYRHSFATDSLLAGNSLATVAALLGHSSTAMVSRVYGHLDQHNQHLLDAVRKTSQVRSS